MKIAEVRKLGAVDRLLYWIREREWIRTVREKGKPQPWTDDDILSTYRFCNVRRMDDRVSVWLLEDYYEYGKMCRATPKRHLVAAALARHFNSPVTLEAIRGAVYLPSKPDWEYIKKTVRDMKSAGFTVFNGAYMVRGIGTSDKTEMVVDKVCQPLHNNPPPIVCSSLRETVNNLLPYWGFSTFMAGQVVADLRWVVPGVWGDRQTWAPQGPGSLRGLNRLHSRVPGDPLSKHQWEQEFTDYMESTRRALPPAVAFRLEAMDFQNCLCEWDKYERALWGQGKPKQLYRPKR